MIKDLTVGRPGVALTKFTFPLLGSVLFQQLYNIADSLIAGKFVGESALAAVGNAYEVTLIYLAFGVGCNMAGSVIVARLFGAKEYDKMKTGISTFVTFTAIICGILMALGFLLCPGVLHLINTPASVYSNTILYLNIYTGGLAFLFMYNILTGLFSAMGDSRTPFIFLACSSTANVVLDFIFVYYLNMGVAGVAWATFICQGISSLLCLVTIIKRLRSVPGKHNKWMDGKLLKEFIIIAIPSTIQQCCISIGNIIIQRFINDLGEATMAGYAAAIKLNNLVVTVIYAVGNGMSNFASQNIGAKRMDRVKPGLKGAFLINLILYVPILLLYFLAASPLISFFLKDGSSAEALEVGMRFLHIVAPFYIMIGIKIITDGLHRGAGAMKLFMISTMVDLIVRVVLAGVFAKVFRLDDTGIWMAWPVGWAIGTFLSVMFYVRGTWKRNIRDL